MTQTFELFPGVTLRCFPDRRFKQGCLSFQIIRPMCAAEASLNALLPAVLLRGTEIHPDLREMNVGDLEMFSYQEISDNPDYLEWIADTAGDYRIPGAETKNEMSARIMRCVHTLAARPENAIAVICHGGTICNIMTNLFPAGCASFLDWAVKPCKGYAINFEDGKAVSFDCI